MSRVDMRPQFGGFGSVVATYTGEGQVSGHNMPPTPCSFEAWQFSSGQILIECSSQYYLSRNDVSLIGQTDEDQVIRTDDGLLCVDCTWSNGQNGASSVCLYSARELWVGEQSFACARSVMYEVVNLRMYANPRRDHCCTVITDKSGIEFEIQIHRKSDYERSERQLRVAKGFAVTTVLTVTSSTPTSLDVFDDLAHDVLDLLSLSRSTRVRWISRKVDDQRGVLYHAAHNVSEFHSVELIPSSYWFATETLDLLSYGLPRYEDARTRLRADELLDVYLDALVSHDHLQTRGIKMAVVGEIVALTLSRDLVRSDDIVSRDEFESLAIEIYADVRVKIQGMTSFSASQKQSLRDKFPAVLRSWNRRSLLRQFIDAFSSIGFTPHRKEIELFIASRNKLVHEGDFCCNVASDGDRQRTSPLPTMIDEYMFLNNFIGRLLLCLVGYSGRYSDLRSTENVSMTGVNDPHWPHPLLSSNSTE